MTLKEAKESVATFIRDMDMFGHTITFNFDRKGETHNTIVGGSFSIIIRFFLTFYVAICFKRLIYHERDTITTTLMLEDLVNSGGVDYMDLNMTIFWVLRKQDLKATAMAKKDDLLEYIDPYFVQESANWYKPANDGRFKSKRVEARPCKVEDFGEDDRGLSKKIFADWAGFLLYCPDITERG